MNYKKITTSFALLLLLSFNANAQNGNYDLRNVITPSATTASLGKYGEIPVSLYTGIPDITIPLYEIKDGPLNLPITLSYHSGGIRVEEIAPNVGLGWSLNAGGLVGRQQRGIPDEYGWVVPAENRIDNILQNGTQGQVDQMTIDVENGIKDGEADIYYYNCSNGQSGKFLFDQSGTLHNYPAKNVSITPTGGGFYGEGWKIITEDGTIYEFDKEEEVTSISCKGGDDDSKTAWYLTKITSSDGKRQISFTYENVTYSASVFLGETRYFSLNGIGGCINETTAQCAGTNIFNTPRLKQIDFSGGYVKFNYNNARQDIYNGDDKSLDQIEVYNSANTLIKKYDLAYSYFSDGGSSVDDKRLKLISVTEKSATDQKPPYTFTYEESIQLPNRLSLSTDHWGYYNGKTNTTYIASFEYPNPFTGHPYTFNGADKNANPATMQAGVLKKIQYPTGGETDFTYECNTTADTRITPTTNDLGNRPVGGLRIKQIENKPASGGQSVIRKYRYESDADPNQSSGILVNFPEYGYELTAQKYLGGQSAGEPCYLDATCVYLVQQSKTNYPLASTEGSYVGYYHVIEDLENNGEIQHWYNVYSLPNPPFPFAPLEYSDWQLGAETSTKYYTKKNDELVLSKETSYGYTPTNLEFVKGYKVGRDFITTGTCGTLWTSAPLTQYNVIPQFWALTFKHEHVYDQKDPTKYIESTTDYTYDPNHYQLTQVRTSTSSTDPNIKDEIIVNKKYPQDYFFTGTASGTEAQGIKKLQDLHIVNVPIEEYSVRQERNISTNAVSDQRVTSGMITTYKYDNPYPDQIYRLETNTTIPLSTYGTGSGLSSNVFIKNFNSTVANAFKSAITFNSYDSYGNLTQQQKANDILHSYIWGYNKMYPVAEVTGISQSQAMSVLSQSVLDNPGGDAALRTELNKIRINFPSAQTNSYTYKPLTGITSHTDINNITSYYYYDAFGRLILIKDKDGKILKKICYNNQGQTNSCSLYGNVQKSQAIAKGDCGPNETGSQVTYTVAADTYYGSTQAEADALAQADIDANGHAYANAHGTCTAQATIYVNNFTTDTYYLNFYNALTYQNYGYNLNPWDSPTISIPAGTYTVSVTPMGYNYPTYFYILNYYSTYGTSAYFSNVSVSGSSNSITIGD